jgi:hypothetical protein
VRQPGSCGTLHHAATNGTESSSAAILPAIAGATLDHRAFSDASSRSVPLCLRQARLKLVFSMLSKRRRGFRPASIRGFLRDSTPRQFAQTFMLLILFSGLTVAEDPREACDRHTLIYVKTMSPISRTVIMNTNS